VKLSYFLIFFLGTLSPATNTPIPTVTDNAFAQHIITANEIGISFEPTTVPEILNGELTWGTYAINCIIGIIVLTDVIQVEPTAASSLAQLRSCMYFGLDPY
jgi:cathepsin E